jgi:hypothetical protein
MMFLMPAQPNDCDKSGLNNSNKTIRTRRSIQRRVTSFFEFGLPSLPWMAYTVRPLSTRTMRTHILLPILTLVLFLGVVASRAQAPNSKEPDDLDRLRKDYLQRRAEALRPVTTRYQADLETLLKKLTQRNDLEGALFVKKELEATRESSLQEAAGDLKKALLATKWSWTDEVGEKGVAMTFKDDGTVSHIGMRGTWQPTGPREVTITVSDGAKVVLRFDATFSSYNQADGSVRGRRWQ